MTQNTPQNSWIRKATLLSLVILLSESWSATAAPKDTVTFIPIGFLSGDDYSSVYVVNDAVTLAGCTSYHRDPVTFARVFNFASRWTPADGLQPLPRLPNTPSADFALLAYAAGRDVTADGSRIAFTAPTEDQTARAAGISDPDGSNLIALTSLSNGEKMQVVNQISDDGLTAFGYTLVNYFGEGSFWTAAGGIQSLVPLPGYTNIAPTPRAISADGTVSVGDVFNYDPQALAIIASQAYRWTSSGGVQGIGYLPGGNRSTASAVTPDGSQVLGSSSTATSPDGSPDTFFLWNTSGGMTDLGHPKLPGYAGGIAISADGGIAMVAFGAKSYIRRIDYPFYFDFEEVLAQAGAGSAIDGWSGFGVSGMTDDGNTVYGQATNPAGRPEGFIAQFPANYFRTLVAPLPEITSSLSASGTLGEYFSFVVTASGLPETIDATGLPAGLEITPVYMVNDFVGLVHGTPTEIGEFPVTISATNVAGTGSATFMLTVQDSPLVPKLLNISTRAQILTNEDVLIGGFVITGNELKKVMLRAVGPSLTPFGITDALADPLIELHEPDGSVVTNDNWKDSQQTEIEATGLAPNDELESALIVTLAPGSYTAIVSGKDGGTGVGLVEAYDLDQAAQSKLANISTRGFVDTEANVLIGGVIVGSVGGKVVVRAIGPSLEAAGVTGVLLDPVLEIHNADGSILASNDDWRETQEADIEASGFAPADDRESTIVATLPANSYTAIVQGKNDMTGVGLIEVYNLD
jgi:hypothetical protein